MTAQFEIFALLTFGLWLTGLVLIYARKQPGVVLIALGTVVMTLFTIYLWIELERAPMRTLGETRLWYGLFLPFIGLIVYLIHQYKWFITYSIVLAMLFLSINILHPENFDKSLMPALQSIWFVPHVIVYMLAYALLAASSLVSAYDLYKMYFGQAGTDHLALADSFVNIGFSFLTMGIIFGALWAKTAWGHYWTWDPKETWALITWMSYLLYLHVRFRHPSHTVIALWILALGFVVLLFCWFGINYLPAAQSSVHTY